MSFPNNHSLSRHLCPSYGFSTYIGDRSSKWWVRNRVCEPLTDWRRMNVKHNEVKRWLRHSSSSGSSRQTQAREVSSIASATMEGKKMFNVHLFLVKFMFFYWEKLDELGRDEKEVSARREPSLWAWSSRKRTLVWRRDYWLECYCGQLPPFPFCAVAAVATDQASPFNVYVLASHEEDPWRQQRAAGDGGTTSIS